MRTKKETQILKKTFETKRELLIKRMIKFPEKAANYLKQVERLEIQIHTINLILK